MRVLVLGAGAREHALCWALGKSDDVSEILCAPGNPGISRLARCVPINPVDTSAVVATTVAEDIDLVVVGPEAPLVVGVVDAVLAQTGVRVFGPTKAAAQLEGSKSFAKQIMAAAGVPTAAHWTGSDPSEAVAALDRFSPPYVVKADGLAAGKGVAICEDREAARRAIRESLIDGCFGAAGATVVIEEFLDGPEVSLFGISDGTRVLPLSPAQDFKRIGDGDTGPNTGGMGAYSPVPMVDTTMTRGICEHMLQPIIDGMSDRGMPFVGLLYAGLVLTADGPKVLEYNARFGDPETQVVLPRMTTDLAHLLWSAADGNVVEQVKFSDDAAVTVVAASRGYPQAPMTGTLIERLDVAESTPGALVFHAGIREQDGRFYSDGGRVLSVTGLGHTLQEARQISYHALDSLAFEGMQFRTDIAAAASSI